MRKRLFATTATVVTALSFGALGITGVALAGEPTTVTETVPAPAPPADTVTVPVPGPTETQTVPGPTTTVTVPSHAPKKHKSSGGGSGNSGSSHKGSSHKGSSNSESTATATIPRTSAALTFTGSNTDTGTVPTGGIQAGAGGTAVNDGTPVLLALSLGLLAFGLTSGGVALRRRASEH